jgi:hypothetical protein
MASANPGVLPGEEASDPETTRQATLSKIAARGAGFLQFDFHGTIV